MEPHTESVVFSDPVHLKWRESDQRSFEREFQFLNTGSERFGGSDRENEFFPGEARSPPWRESRKKAENHYDPLPDKTVSDKTGRSCRFHSNQQDWTNESESILHTWADEIGGEESRIHVEK